MADEKESYSAACTTCGRQWKDGVEVASEGITQAREAILVTEDYRLAPSGIGPHADTWADKPHRLVYDLCNEVRRLQAAHQEQAQEIARLTAELADVKASHAAYREESMHTTGKLAHAYGAERNRADAAEAALHAQKEQDNATR